MSKEDKEIITVAGRIAANVKAKDDNFAIDPFTILAIVNVLIGIIRMVMECRSNREQAKKIIRKPGVIARYLMRREIKKHFPPHERRGVYSAMLSITSSLSEKEIDKSFDLVEKELNK